MVRHLEGVYFDQMQETFGRKFMQMVFRSFRLAKFVSPIRSKFKIVRNVGFLK